MALSCLTSFSANCRDKVVNENLRRAVFLDRDGVLVKPDFREGRSFAARTLTEFSIYPYAKDCVHRLQTLGFLVVVVTNQPDVTAGLLSIETVIEMHRLLLNETGVDDIEVCYDSREKPTRRRKPQPGMLEDSAAKLNIDPLQSYMVGDREIDIEAGNQIGCTTIFVDLGYTAHDAPHGQAVSVLSLVDAVAWICSRENLTPI